MDIEKYKQIAQDYKDDYPGWLNKLIIPKAGFEPVLFSDVAEAWQIEEAKVIGGSIKNIWHPNSSIYRNVWITRPRGHDKTSSIARAVIWAIMFPRPSAHKSVPLDVRVVAVDSEQAQILIDIANTIIQLNDLSNIIQVSQNSLAGPGGKASIISADAPSAYGKIVHLLIFDELTHWTTPKSKKLFDAMWSGRSKVANSCTIILTNAGYKGTWQYSLLQSLKVSPSWYVYDEPGRLAQWHQEETVSEITKALAMPEIERLIYNKWVENETSNIYNYLMENIVQEQPCKPSYVIISIDYASKRDLTAIAIVEISNIIWVKDIIAGHFSHDEICEILIEQYNKHIHISPTHIVADIYQMEYIRDELMKRASINVTLIKPTAQSNKRMTSLLMRCCEAKILRFSSPYLGEYNGTSLETEARYCQISSSPPKIITPPGIHDDRLHSICYSLLHAYNQKMLRACGISVEPVDISSQSDRQQITIDRAIPERLSATKNIYGILIQPDQTLKLQNPLLNTEQADYSKSIRRMRK